MSALAKANLIWILLACYLFTAGFTVIGHRGDPLKAPEETYQSDDDAFAAGAEYVELDVQESADGQIVIQHDDSLLRMTGHDVLIRTNTLATLQQYHTKNGETIHSLADLFKHYANTKAKFLIETKVDKAYPHPDMEAKIAALVNAYHMTNRIMFHSFSTHSLKRLAKLLPTVPRYFIVGTSKKINFGVFAYTTGIDLSVELVSANIVKALHDLGQKVLIWDEMTESPERWSWLSNLNIDGIVTNYPSIAAQYAKLKAVAATTTKQQLVTNDSDVSSPIVENPYTATATTKQIAPGETRTAIAKVTIGQTSYYRLGQNSFVATTNMNPAPVAGWANLLLNQTVTLRRQLAHQDILAGRRAPLNQQQLLKLGASSVTAVMYRHNQLWCAVAGTWLKATSLQLAVNTARDTNWLTQYASLPRLIRPAVIVPVSCPGILALGSAAGQA